MPQTSLGTQAIDQNLHQTNPKVWRASHQVENNTNTPRKKHRVQSTEKMVSSASSIHKDVLSNQVTGKEKPNLGSVDKIPSNNLLQPQFSKVFVERNRPLQVQEQLVSQHHPLKPINYHAVNVQNEYFTNQNTAHTYGLESQQRSNSQSRLVYLQPHTPQVQMRMTPQSISVSDFNSVGPRPNLMQMQSSERVIQMAPKLSSGNQLRMSNQFVPALNQQMIIGRPISGPAFYMLPSQVLHNFPLLPSPAQMAPAPVSMRQVPVNLIQQQRFSYQSANPQPPSFQAPMTVFKPN